MSNKTDEILKQALEVYKVMKKKEKEAKELKDSLDIYTAKLESEMGRMGQKELENIMGKAIWVEQNRKGALDEKKIAVKLGLPDLAAYRKPGKVVQFVKYSLNKLD